ncbi:septation protein SepH [Nocardioides caeni]|nr:septation protein SepH [Nocardioides caeni]
MTDDQAPADPVRLALTGVSEDRGHLLLVDDQGGEFTLDLTPELRAAARRETETPRTGRLETKMSSTIRPREIQTRIRAGETAETVAQAAGTTVDAIMPYVAPVLAEREHVAARAQKASVRRAPGEGSAPQGRLLGDAVSAHLVGIGVSIEDVTWDAYRRETGRWVLTGTYACDQRSGTARFTYDAPGNYVLSDNDDARWLIGDVLPEPEPAPARDDLQQARERRLSVVAADELPLGGLDELPLGGQVDRPVVEEPAGVAAPATPVHDPADAPATAAVEEAPVLDEPLRPTADEPLSSTDPASDAEHARHRRPAQKKRGRASVPSWDEIMFGSSDQG